jgi:hypothetical protein
VEALFEKDRQGVGDDHNRQQPEQPRREPTEPNTDRPQLASEHQIDPADEQHGHEDDQRPGVEVQSQDRVPVAGVRRDDVEQHLPGGDARARKCGQHAHAVAGREVARFHVSGARLQQDMGRPERAQQHGHALQHAERTRELARAELHPKGAGQHTANGRDVEMSDPEPETVAHARLPRLRS